MRASLGVKIKGVKSFTLVWSLGVKRTKGDFGENKMD